MTGQCTTLFCWWRVKRVRHRGNFNAGTCIKVFKGPHSSPNTRFSHSTLLTLGCILERNRSRHSGSWDTQLRRSVAGWSLGVGGVGDGEWKSGKEHNDVSMHHWPAV